LTVKGILDAYKIPFFLIFGTLLGAYRDKDFIKHDSDIDIGLLEQYNEKIVELINDGYFAIYGLKYIREWHEKKHIRALQYKSDYIDLWFFDKRGKQYYSGAHYNIYASQIDCGFSKIMFYGQKYNAPNDIEAYLSRHYYKSDWKIPVEDYHAKF
jgi:phosphorylcholine metabolism protein LicD